jgi:hypothetical protein
MCWTCRCVAGEKEFVIEFGGEISWKYLGRLPLGRRTRQDNIKSHRL